MKAAEKRQKEHERRAEKKVQKVAFNPALMFFPVYSILSVWIVDCYFGFVRLFLGFGENLLMRM